MIHNPKAGSTQQISALMHLLLSTGVQSDQNTDYANSLLRSIILLRDGGEFAYKTSKNIYWGSDKSEDDTIVRAGASIGKKQHFLSDVITEILQDEEVLMRAKHIFPNLESSEIESISHFAYRVLRNLEYSKQENSAKSEDLLSIDVSEWHKDMKKYYRYLKDEYGSENFE